METMTAQQFRKQAEKHLSESQLQAKCVKWFRTVYPEFAKLLYAIPNGANKSMAQRVKFKLEGLTAGVPDLHLAIAANDYHSLYIEMKKHGGKVSDEQKEMIALLQKKGHQVVICKSSEEFETAVKNYLQ